MSHRLAASVVCTLAWLALAARAQEPPAAPLAPALATGALSRLAPTSEARHRERVRALEQQLEQLVLALPRVERVRVQLALPDPAALALDQPLPTTRAAVVIVARGRAPERTQIAALLGALLPGFDEAQLALVSSESTSAKAPAPLAHVGPFMVSTQSAQWLRVTLAGSLAVNALLAALVLGRSRRDRPRQPKVDPHAQSGGPL